MREPYKILGVSEDADSDEIKRAYRQLSRKYHPDANINNPNKDLAEAKFKEIQDAYNQIINEREKGEDTYSSFFGGFRTGGYSQNQNNYDTQTQHFKAAEVYINNRKFREAINVLNGMAQKTSMWYYYHAAANQGLGNHIIAVEEAETALRMEPDNMLYQQFYDRIRSGNQWYQNQGEAYGFSTDSFGDCCIKILMFNCICGCCLR